MLFATLLFPGSAAAAAEPSCFNAEVWARPGLERDYALTCARTERVELATAPRHGTVEDLRVEGGRATWRYRPAADAPTGDSLALRLTGPGGSATQTVAVHVVPSSENSAPVCQPVQAARRTDGAGPAELEFYASCWDADHDAMRLDGDGPGEHLTAPGRIAGGHAWTEAAHWRYRTVSASGEESATLWATDDLGARSADAAVSVAVGPAVNRATECRPNPVYTGRDHFPIHARPGAVRRFGLVCDDADGDAFTASVGATPQRGALTTFAPGELQRHANRSERWIDAAYTPAAASQDADPFTVVAEDTLGLRSETRMAIVSRPLGENSGGACGSTAGQTSSGAPTVLRFSCTDDDGDRLEASIAQAPGHGSASAPAIAPGPFGADDVSVAYTPDPGFAGLDRLRVRVTDGSGLAFEVPLEVRVTERPSAPRPSPTSVLPAAAAASAASAPALSSAEQARRALHVRRVVLIGRAGPARIYAAATGPRRAVAVTCELDCRLHARFTPAGAATSRRVAAAPGRATVVALPRRRPRGPALALRLSVTPRQGAATRTTVRVRPRG